MSDLHDLVADLADEYAVLDANVADLAGGDDRWKLPTPSPGWRVVDQIGHLAYFDGTAVLAATDVDAFARSVIELRAASAEGRGDAISLCRTLEPGALLETWRTNRGRLLDAMGSLADDARLPWYGPDMGTKSFVTARLMETWAHGQDVVDALGATRPASDRLRHIARLGFLTRGWTYVNRGLPVPTEPVRLDLRAPSGATWTFGPDDASDVVRGEALDFCLVTTQRRNVGDTGLAVVGGAAQDWMGKAQAFAGPPTDPPPARVGVDGGSVR